LRIHVLWNAALWRWLFVDVSEHRVAFIFNNYLGYLTPRR